MVIIELVWICILIGAGAKLFVPFWRKVIAGDLYLSEFDKKYLYNSITALVWQFALGTGLFATYDPPFVLLEILVYPLAIVFGFAGPAAQEEFAKDLNAIYARFG